MPEVMLTAVTSIVPVRILDVLLKLREPVMVTLTLLKVPWKILWPTLTVSEI